MFDPVIPVYHEWLAARREWRALAEIPGNENMDTPQMVACEQRIRQAAMRMLQVQPTTLPGIGAIVALLWAGEKSMYLSIEEGASDDTVIEQLAVQSIWRACTGRGGYPDV